MVPGIQVRADPSLGIIVSLGQDGRGGGRYLEKVQLFRKNPPEIENGFIYNAHPVRFNTNLDREDGHFYMLAKAKRSSTVECDCRVIARIKTRWIYTRGSHGTWGAIAGAPETLASGYGAHGLTIQRAATWHDGLVLFSPGDAVCIRPEGAHKAELYVLYCDENGILQDMLFSEYKSQVAVDGSETEVYI